VSDGATVDTSNLTRFMRELSSGLRARGDDVARRQADTTASKIKGRVPVRTGRLSNTVAVVPVTNGFGVTYGGDLPYARYIERRSNAVADGVSGSEVTFARDAETMARTVVGESCR
jgi:hypothetical protein